MSRAPALEFRHALRGGRRPALVGDIVDSAAEAVEREHRLALRRAAGFASPCRTNCPRRAAAACVAHAETFGRAPTVRTSARARQRSAPTARRPRQSPPCRAERARSTDRGFRDRARGAEPAPGWRRSRPRGAVDLISGTSLAPAPRNSPERRASSAIAARRAGVARGASSISTDAPCAARTSSGR